MRPTGYFGRAAPFAAALAMSIALAPQAWAASKRFDIPAQPLSEALIDFAIQADVSIGLGDAKIGARRTSAFQRTATAEEALAALLEGTGFGFRKIDERSFVVVSAPSAAAPAKIEGDGLTEEIVVTARKRSEVLARTPFSVAAVEVTERAPALHGLEGITSLVAGLASTNQGPGRNKYFIRGMSDGAFSGQTENAVGLYLDDTRITFNTPDPNLQLVDIARIEVVRGPEGTLYGAGAIGGLIRIITNPPEIDRTVFKGAVGVAATNGGALSTRVETTANLPLIEGRLAVRLTGYAHRDGGYIDDTALGRSNVNGAGIYGIRASFGVVPSDRWSIEAGAVLQGIGARDTQYYDGAMARYTRDIRVREPHDNDFRRLHVRAAASFDNFRFESSTAWLRQSIASTFDASAAVAQFTAAPSQSALYRERARHTTLIHESRVISNTAGRFDWLAGVFASHRDQLTDSVLTALDLPATSAQLYTSRRYDNGDELAAFGEFSYRFTPATTATVGMRWFRGGLDTDASASGGNGPLAPNAIGRNVRTGFTPKVVVSHNLDEAVLLYAQAAEGYRLGGINVDAPLPAGAPPTGDEGEEDASLTVTNFKSDTLWNFEIGGKATLWDGAAAVNAAAFSAVWRNIQTDQIATNGLPYTANVGTAHIRGLEVEATVHPSQPWTLTGNLTWSSPELTTLAPASSSAHNDHLPSAPRFSAGASLQYAFALPDGVGAEAGVSYAYVSRSHLNFGAAANLEMGNTHLADARLRFTRGRFGALLYVDNLANTGANTFAFGNAFSFARMRQVTPPRPRTVGLTFSWSN
ncbi:MAG: TonB-dependent receptor [Rhodospirillaceae bacterium]